MNGLTLLLIFVFGYLMTRKEFWSTPKKGDVLSIYLALPWKKLPRKDHSYFQINNEKPVYFLCPIHNSLGFAVRLFIFAFYLINRTIKLASAILLQLKPKYGYHGSKEQIVIRPIRFDY